MDKNRNESVNNFFIQDRNFKRPKLAKMRGPQKEVVMSGYWPVAFATSMI